MPSPKPRHANLKLIEGRGNGTDSGGRKVKTPPAFHRIPPEKPDYITGYAATFWDRVVEQLPQLGLLKDLDGPSLEMMCQSYAVWRKCVEIRLAAEAKAPDTGGILGRNSQGIVQAPWYKTEREAATDFRAWCGEYGLTPSAEMRLAGPTSGTGEPNGDNPYAGSSG